MKSRILQYLLFCIVLAGLFWAAATGFSAANKRQVTYTYIADALSPTSGRPNRTQWNAAETQMSRGFTNADAHLIGTALTHAWTSLSLAQARGTSEILSESFSGVGLERAFISVTDAQTGGGRIAVLDQIARPIFYHKDGSIFQAETETVAARYVVSPEGLQFHQLTLDQGLVTLTNESNGWRVFSLERTAADKLPTARTSWNGENLYGLNYYPSDTPWKKFWTNFSAEGIASDFDLIAGLGANSIRIFLTYETFIDPKVSENSLENLQTLLDLAVQRNLTIVPTLFDLKYDFGPEIWMQDANYLSSVLPILLASPAVGFVDIKNEPDLDFRVHGEANITAWLKTMDEFVRHMAPGISTTIGWSNAEAALLLLDNVDVVTYHEYQPTAGTSERLAVVQAAANGKPVIITEIGASSYDTALGFPGNDLKQADVLETRIKALDAADGIMVWTLHDFPEVDPDVVGSSPWVKRLQAKFGLYDQDGTEKPAAAAIRSLFSQEDR